MTRMKFIPTMYVDVVERQVYLDLQKDDTGLYTVDKFAIYHSEEELENMLDDCITDPEFCEKETPELIKEVLTRIEELDNLSSKHQVRQPFKGKIIFQPGW